MFVIAEKNHVKKDAIETVCIKMRAGFALRHKDVILIGDEVLREGVDGPDVRQGEGLVVGPHQVGAEHHGQVGRGHLVQAASIHNLREEMLNYKF